MSVEARIACLEAMKKDYETEMCRPDTHKNPYRIKFLTLQMQKAHQELEGLYERWAELMDCIESASP